MSNLLTAGFSRLRKDRVFWLAVVLVVLVTGLTTLQASGSYKGDLARGLPMDDMEDYFFSNAPAMGILTAVFVSLYWGAEYSDGAIRSKLCVGCRRSQVYLSHFTVCLTANLIFLGLLFLGTAPLYFTVGPMAMGWIGFLVYAATCVCFTVAFTALFTLICAAVTNRAYSVVASLGVWVALQVAAGSVHNRLCEPEISAPGMQLSVNGEMVMTGAGPNPLYIGGALRVALEVFRELLPTGQALLVNDIAIEHPVRGILLSLAFTGLMLGIGIQMFRKKEIR